MKTIEIKGVWGFIGFIALGLLLIASLILLPTTLVWVSWNALIYEGFRGPLIAFWQAGLLTAIVAVALKILFQPQISLEVKRVKNPDELQPKE